MNANKKRGCFTTAPFLFAFLAVFLLKQDVIDVIFQKFFQT
jgi:hypothetical protein